MKNKNLIPDNFYKTVGHQQLGGYLPEKYEFIAKHIGLKQLKVLDIGCSDGYFAEKISDLGHSVVGVDISEEVLELARKRGIESVQTNVETDEFSFKNESFDVIILGDIIEHIFDTDKLLRKCIALIKPGGRIFISTPNVASFARRCMLLVGISPFLEYSIEMSTNNLPSVGHIRYYTFDNLKKQLNRHGLKIVESESDIINLGFFSSSILAKLFPSLGRQIFLIARKKL